MVRIQIQQLLFSIEFDEDLNYMVQFFLATCNAIILKILQVTVAVQPEMMHIIANEFTLIAGYSASGLAKFLSFARQVADGRVRRCNLSHSIAKSRSWFNFPCNLQCNFLLRCKLQTRGVRRCILLCNLQRKPL